MPIKGSRLLTYIMLGASSVSCDSSTKICDIFSSHDDRLLEISDDDEMSSQPLSYILTEPYVTNVAIPQRTTHIYHVPFYLL